jgi:hypothetical protein
MTIDTWCTEAPTRGDVSHSLVPAWVLRWRLAVALHDAENLGLVAWQVWALPMSTGEVDFAGRVLWNRYG